MTDPVESPIRVLVVDDEPALLEIAKEFLEQVPGFMIEVERSPIKALEVLTSRRFDAVISDYQMPDMDGLVFLKNLRSRGDDIPFILLTGKGREEVAMEALNNGADHYLQKESQIGTQFAELANMVRRSVEHKRNGRALKESEIKYHRLFNNNRDAILVWRLDEHGQLIDANEKACSLLNYSREELLILDKTALFHLENTPEKQRRREFFLNDNDTTIELGFISKNGETIPCLVTASIMEIDGMGHVISILRDQRDKQRSDKEAKEHEARFQAIFDHSATGIALEDSDRRILECNPAFCQTFHRNCDELLGTTAYDIMDPVSAMDDHIEFERLMRGELGQYTKEKIYLNKDGSQCFANVHFSLFRDNGRNLALVMVEDVTKKKKAEKLQSSLYQISQATVSAPNLDVLYGRFHNILSDLMPAKNFFIGLLADKGESIVFPYFVDEKDPNPNKVCRGKTTSNYVIRTGQAMLMDVDLWAKLIGDGEMVVSGTLPVHWMGAPLKVGGTTIGLMVVQSYTATVKYSEMDLEVLKFVSDHVALAIDLKRSEEALKESQRMLSTLMGNLPGMAYRCKNDKEWTMNFISEGCRMVTGYAPEELTGNALLSYNDLIHPEDQKVVADGVRRGVEGRDRFHMEYRVIAKDGTLRWLWEQGCPVYDEAGEMVGLEGFITDVTNRRRAQENERRANWKLTLLGDLTRHDVLNRVTMLSGYLQLIENNVEDGKVRKYLEKAMMATRSIEEQMEFIKEYQGLGVGEPEWFDLECIISMACSKMDFGHIKVSSDVGGLSIYSDPMIEKVFANLFENSVKHGKTVSNIDISFLKGEDRIDIYFRDDGQGIPSDVKQHLFDRNYMHRLGHGMNFILEVLRITGLEIDEIGELGKGVLFRIKVPAGCYRVMEIEGKSYMNDGSLIGPERADK